MSVTCVGITQHPAHEFRFQRVEAVHLIVPEMHVSTLPRFGVRSLVAFVVDMQRAGIGVLECDQWDSFVAHATIVQQGVA